MMSKALFTCPALSYIQKVLIDFSICLPDQIKLSEQPAKLSNDSRTMATGDIFCAIIGHNQDGRQYIEQAFKQGAKLVLSECENKAEHGQVNTLEIAGKQLAIIGFYQLNKQLFKLASAFYQSPEQNLTMIGITGTNGKTSTSHLLGQLLSQCHKPCAIIGTNGAGPVDNLQPLENTTPSATDLVQLFSRFSQTKVHGKNITHLAMEVSSHALEQKRITGNTFNIAIFTNLSRDHLDYHGTMANYAAAKHKIFTHENDQIAILNGDDTQAQYWLKNWSSSDHGTQQVTWLYGRNENVRQHSHYVSCSAINHHHKGVSFTLKTHLGEVDIYSPLLGDFNIDNLLAVIAVLLIEGIELTTIAEKIKYVKAITGRMEAFSSSLGDEQTPTAVVDYAHTPDALEKALIACRQHCNGNVFVVFGCGGDRDKGKRPLMAKAAQQYADYLVITNDNPRTEQPMDIINDIIAGLESMSNIDVIVDRKQAVLTTLAKAQAHDVVLLAGKGHENYIILGHNKIEYNERALVKSFF